MSDLSSIEGKALLDRKVFVSILAHVEPIPLDENSTLYHIGYEAAKRDLMEILGRALGPDFARSHATKLLMELRGG